MRSSAKAEKFKRHIKEVEKIVSLIFGLSGRLARTENTLNNCDWNGIEERDDLERKKEKLQEQLDEAKLLWESIDRRTESIAGSVEEFLGREESMRYKWNIRKKVKLMLEGKEIEEMIEYCLNYIKAVNTM